MHALMIDSVQTVYLWDAASGSIQELCRMESDNYVCSVSWIENGSALAIGLADSTVQLWDVHRQKKMRTLRSHDSRVSALSWNSAVLASGCKSGAIACNDVRIAESLMYTMQGHTQEVCGLKWSPDGRFLARYFSFRIAVYRVPLKLVIWFRMNSGGNDNLVNIWDNAGHKVHTLAEHQAAVKALAWCPWQSNLLATGGGTADRHIRFWNTTSGVCLNAVDTKSQVSSLLWNKEHHEIVSAHGFSRNQLIIWKYPTMSKVAELDGHTERVLAMAMSPDGTTVLSAGGDETLRFWKCFAT
jgi:cell division cycle 20, cofactor of APC complex